MVRFPLFALALIAPTPLFAQAAGVQSVPRATIVANADAEFKRVDTNKDGQMSRAEIETTQRTTFAARVDARNKALFAELDSDKNGQISPVEFAKATPVPKADASAVLRVDTNKDGQVSLAEHRSATIDTFTKIDTNKDGMITGAEVQAASSAK